MKITQFAVNRPVTTLMLFLASLLFGVISFFKLPIDFMPKLESPVISILTFWPGASTEDVETKITKVIESNLNIINNLEEIKSTSKEGISIVNCSFEQNIDMSEASNDIRDRLEFAKAYMPSDVSDPIIFKFNTAMMPIVFYGITAKENWEKLHDIVEEEISRPLQRLPGVGGVQVIGGMQRQLNIKLKREKLSAYNLSVSEIEENLKRQNLSMPAGQMKVGDIEYLLRIPGEYKNLLEIENVILKQIDKHIVRLSDVAEIEDNFKEQKYKVEIDGRNAVMLIIQKRAEANTVEVANLVQEEMKRITPNLSSDIKASLIMNSSEFIKLSVNNLMKTALWAIFFVALVTYYFFRSFRSASIIILMIPFSIIIVFLFIYSQSWTINIMSLAAIAIAIGMVVDNSVVILDSIMKYTKENKDLKKASILAAKEVGVAIGASTLTTIVVFVPLIFLKGVTGILFMQLGAVVGITLLASLFCALMLAPMLTTKLLRNKSNKSNPKLFKIIEDKYIKILSYSLKHKKKIVFVTISLFIGSLFLLPFIGTEFMPQEDSGDINIIVNLQVGTAVEKTSFICKKIENEVKELIGNKYILHSYYRCGAQDSGLGAAFNRQEGSHIGQIGLKLVKQKNRNFKSKDLIKKISDSLKQFEDIEKLSINDANPMSMIFGNQKPISIEILGHDILKTEKIAQDVKQLAQQIKGTKDVSITRDLGKPELVIEIDRQKATSLGLNVAIIANSLRTLFHGKKATNYQDKEHDYDVFMRLDSTQRQNIDDINSTVIKTPFSQNIILSNIAKIKEKLGPVEIERQNQQRVVKVEMNIYGRSQGNIIKDLKKNIKNNIILPQEISIEFGGLAKEQVKAFKFLFLMVILGIIFVYMVMAAQFESLKYPFIIMFSMPFALIGVFLSLFITHTTLNALSFIGIVMLIGIVVNNAIVLVDYINKIKDQKKNLEQTILLAGKHRLRPVLMTTLTTIFGMFSLVISTGEGSEMWRPLGIAVIGGLMVSTLITLVFIPIMYLIFEKKKLKKSKFLKNK